MLTPSYSQLMEKINTDKLEDSKITSRYTIVLAVAKRARQIIDGAEPLSETNTDRAVSIAVKEMGEGKIKINVEEDFIDESYERMLASQTKLQNVVAVASSDDLREDLKDSYDPVLYVKDDDDDTDEPDFSDGFTEVTSDSYLYDDDADSEKEEKFEDFDDEDEDDI